MKDKKIDFLENEQNDSIESAQATAAKAGKKPAKITAVFKSRKFKRGWMSVLLSVIFIAVVVGLNIVSTLLTNRFPSLSVDLTANGAYELTQTSVDYLSKLDKDIEICVLTEEKTLESQGEYYVQANKLLHQFDTHSDKVSLKYINLAQNPTFISKYPDIDWQSSSYIILVSCGDEYRGLKPDDIFEFDQQSLSYYGEYVATGQTVEQGVVSAMLNVTTENKIGVTILSGHGEQDCTAFSDLLQSNAYSVENVSLLNGKISDSSQFVVIYAPTQDIDKDTYDTLVDWLYNNGNYGRTLLYVPNDQISGDMPYIDTLLEEWGMAVSDSYIFETDSQHMTNSQNPYMISIFNYSEQDFSSRLRDPNIPVVMMYTVAIDSVDSGVTPLLSSSSSAVRMPKDADQNWDYNNEEPETLCGAAISTKSDGAEEKSSNVIVIGSYSAMTSSALSATSFNNGAYFINLFNTIAEKDEAGITIEGKDLENSQLGITSSFTSSLLGALFEFVLPIAVVVIGVIIWIRRRNR